jgi:hypothetical protein
MTNPQPGRLNLWDRLLRLPRQVIYVFIVLTVGIPLFLPFSIRTIPTQAVRDLYNVVDSMPMGKALIISADYTPDTEAELHPMTIAFLRHAFARRLKVGVCCLQLQGIGLADNALRQVVDEFNSRARTPDDSLRYGRDYVFYGFQTPILMVITGMGEDITKVFPADGYRNRTDTLPISEELRSYSDVGIVISIAASSIPQYWVTYGQTAFGIKVGTGITAVSAADFTPYYATRQFSGMLAGMKGAAEYEGMIAAHHPVAVEGVRQQATERMASQTTAHIGIMLLILIGNISFFATRRRKS